jgi:hypothetical protein
MHGRSQASHTNMLIHETSSSEELKIATPALTIRPTATDEFTSGRSNVAIPFRHGVAHCVLRLPQSGKSHSDHAHARCVEKALRASRLRFLRQSRAISKNNRKGRSDEFRDCKQVRLVRRPQTNRIRPLFTLPRLKICDTCNGHVSYVTQAVREPPTMDLTIKNIDDYWKRGRCFFLVDSSSAADYFTVR